MGPTHYVRTIASVTIVSLIIVATGCARIQVKKIAPGGEDGGLAYCLLVPALQVTTKQALVYDNQVENLEAKGNPPPGPPYDTSKLLRRVTDQTVTLVQLPSFSHYYSATLHSGWFTSDSYSITYDANGCLNTYTFTTADQLGPTIATVGSIALAAAALAAAEHPEVTYPEPLADTVLLERSSKVLLLTAEAKIKELTTKTSLTDQERDTLSNLLDKAAKLRDLLNPLPTQIIQSEYIGLHWIDGKSNADAFIIEQLRQAETTDNKEKFIPLDASGGQRKAFIIGIARRIE